MSETPAIPGADSVIGWFGYWPTFHDATIVELRLGSEPVLVVRAFEITDNVDATGHYRLRKHCVVSFRMADEISFSLMSDSGAGGIVFDLRFQEGDQGLKMEIESSCGINGWIVAKNWRVEIEPAVQRRASGY